MNSPFEPDEHSLLQRYREQPRVQPPAALDARILAAARRAVEAPGASPLVRLGRWLGRVVQAPRGSLAFASLAGMALTVTLLWQVLPQGSQTPPGPLRWGCRKGPSPGVGTA